MPLIEEKRLRNGAAHIILYKDAILFLQRAKEPGRGEWILPGGKVEWGETHSGARSRERKEELGGDLEVEYLGLAGRGSYYIINGGVQRVIEFHFARYIRGEIILSPEDSDWRFYRRDEIAALNLKGAVAAVLRDIGWLEPNSGRLGMFSGIALALRRAYFCKLRPSLDRHFLGSPIHWGEGEVLTNPE